MPLEGLRGKPVALLFFRTSAPVAPRLAREFSRYHNDHSLDPVVFAAVAIDSAERTRSFAERHQIDLPLAWLGRVPGRDLGVGRRQRSEGVDCVSSSLLKELGTGN